MTNKPKYPKRGRPVVHPPIVNEKTGEIFTTYTEAAVACNGDRSCVRRVCEGLLRKHKGCTFRFARLDEIKELG